jgi:hypothetical protein
MPTKKKTKTTKKAVVEEAQQDNVVSNAALERRKRFLAEKEKAGGAENLIQAQKDKEWKLYFDKSGEIVCLTQNADTHIQEGWQTFNFSQEQLTILTSNQTESHKYRVNIDPKVDNLYSIELKSINTIYTEAEKDFLNEIDYGKSTSFDIKCSVNVDELVVSLSNKSKEVYKDVYPISATIKGQRLLKFFLTAEHDPHTMFHYEIISLAELITEKKVTRKLLGDLRHCSVYTVKLFDKYQRS